MLHFFYESLSFFNLFGRDNGLHNVLKWISNDRFWILILTGLYGYNN